MLISLAVFTRTNISGFINTISNSMQNEEIHVGIHHYNCFFCSESISNVFLNIFPITHEVGSSKFGVLSSVQGFEKWSKTNSKTIVGL